MGEPYGRAKEHSVSNPNRRTPATSPLALTRTHTKWSHSATTAWQQHEREAPRTPRPCQSAGGSVFVRPDHGIIGHSATRAISGARTLRQATPSSVWFVCSASVSSDRPVQIKGLAIARVESDPSPLVRSDRIVPLPSVGRRDHYATAMSSHRCSPSRKNTAPSPRQQCAVNAQGRRKKRSTAVATPIACTRLADVYMYIWR